MGAGVQSRHQDFDPGGIDTACVTVCVPEIRQKSHKCLH